MVDLSIVIPVMNEEKNIPFLYNKLKKSLENSKKSYEIIFVDDGSTDGTFSELKRLHSKDNSIRIFNFRKNFGKSEALSLGFEKSRGKIIVTMDGDLQDDPSELPKFLEKLENNDLVVGWRADRKDSITKKFFSRFFNLFIFVTTRLRIHDSNCGFKAMKREVVGDIHIYGELHRYIPVIAHSMGYGVGEVKVRHHPRKFGKSKFNSVRILKGFLDLITIEFLTIYSKRPLHFFGSIGLLSVSSGILICVYMLYLWLSHVRIGDRPLLILGVLLILLGVQFICFGLLGEMLLSNLRTPRGKYKIKNELG